MPLVFPTISIREQLRLMNNRVDHIVIRMYVLCPFFYPQFLSISAVRQVRLFYCDSGCFHLSPVKRRLRCRCVICRGEKDPVSAKIRHSKNRQNKGISWSSEIRTQELGKIRGFTVELICLVG